KEERASVAAKGRQIETEAAPIRYVAELVGADTDSERAIRWLIMLMVLCCDPLAIALTAAASARRGRRCPTSPPSMLGHGSGTMPAHIARPAEPCRQREKGSHRDVRLGKPKNAALR